MAELIKQLSSTFNFVLIDAPPVLSNSDTSVIAGWTRGVLLVARANSTRKADLESAATKLRMAGSEPLGIVLTEQKRPPLLLCDRRTRVASLAALLVVLTGCMSVPQPLPHAPVVVTTALPSPPSPPSVAEGFPSWVAPIRVLWSARLRSTPST